MDTCIQNALLIHNPNAGNGGNGRRKLLVRFLHLAAYKPSSRKPPGPAMPSKSRNKLFAIIGNS
jgi:hypothetical protein